MTFLKKIELEWKILGVAILLLGSFLLPLQSRFKEQMNSIVEISTDSTLQNYLREELNDSSENRDVVVSLLERNLQWSALKPLIIKEQQSRFISFSLLMFVALILLAFISFKSLTKPLKKLAIQLKDIGRGELVEVSQKGSGALLSLQQSVDVMQGELSRLRADAEQQGRESAWKDSARVVAHEIKNPLTPLRLTVDRVEEKLALGEEITPSNLENYLKRINRQLDALESVVNRFRSFSGTPELNMSNHNVADLVRETADSFGNSISTKISGSEVVFIDSSLFNQVILNCYKNSLNAGSTEMEVRVEKYDNLVHLSIKDNGVGADSSMAKRLFLPFVSFSDAGSGIGLSVVKNITESMGGEVSINTSKGNGFETKFILQGERVEL